MKKSGIWIIIALALAGVAWGEWYYFQTSRDQYNSAMPTPSPVTAHNPKQDPSIPVATITTSATNTRIVSGKFSFSLPPRWHGEKYVVYQDSDHWLFQSNMDETGFVIDCPPPGKGFEEAKRTVLMERTFEGIDDMYTITMLRMEAEGNNPWLMIFVTPKSWSGSECLVQGDDMPSIESALQEIYKTWQLSTVR